LRDRAGCRPIAPLEGRGADSFDPEDYRVAKGDSLKQPVPVTAASGVNGRVTRARSETVGLQHSKPMEVAAERKPIDDAVRRAATGFTYECRQGYTFR